MNYEEQDIFLEEDYDPTDTVGDSVKLYLSQISAIPRLTPEEEKELGEKIAAGDRSAAQTLVEHNLLLSVSIAKHYKGCGIPFLDLIQEGNVGLMKAAESFDVSKGFRFSTYASWWVRQTISRALADQGRTIRIPAHISELCNKIKKISNSMTQELGREPSTAELAQTLDTDEETIKTALSMSQSLTSLDAPIGDDDDANVGDLISDHNSDNPITALLEEANRSIIDSVLSTLSEKEGVVLRMRFGIGQEKPSTLEEIGQHFGVTRERIRQIEVKAMRKMRHPSRTRILKEAF